MSSLTPPNISKDNEQRVAPPPPRKGWRRVFNEQTAAMVSALVFTAAIYSVIFFVLPRIRSQRLINGLWLCLAFFLVMTTTDQVCGILTLHGRMSPADSIRPFGSSSRSRRWCLISLPLPRPNDGKSRYRPRIPDPNGGTRCLWRTPSWSSPLFTSEFRPSCPCSPAPGSSPRSPLGRPTE